MYKISSSLFCDEFIAGVIFVDSSCHKIKFNGVWHEHEQKAMQNNHLPY